MVAVPATGDDRPEYPERVWATHPVRGFVVWVTKPEGVTIGIYVITFHRLVLRIRDLGLDILDVHRKSAEPA